MIFALAHDFSKKLRFARSLLEIALHPADFLKVHLLPGWARRPLRLPRLPVTETVLVRPAGHVMVHAMQWAITAPRPAPAA